MTALPDPQRRYCQRKQRTEANANGHDRDAYHYRQRVNAQHQQHGAVFAKVLYCNRIPRPDAFLPRSCSNALSGTTKSPHHANQHQQGIGWQQLVLQGKNQYHHANQNPGWHTA